ncbi:hypothetical protein PG996_002921 [Apiospora saccharicola]|uniref:Lysine-specific metallo-endopeptidase domain-containing protein n=1 Tax=Apiospora saccharicola TaxID=335842 RepID=A0ABR1WNS1_9PEZI
MGLSKSASRLAVGLCLLASSTWTHANAGRTHPRDISTVPITTSAPVSAINPAGLDALLQIRDDKPRTTPFKEFRGCSDQKKKDIVQACHRNDAVDLIHKVYGNILDLWSSKTTEKIVISCEDIPQPWRAEKDRAYCNKKEPEMGIKPIGGYALTHGPSGYDGASIVMCPPFFAPGQEHLADIKKNLDNDKSQQKTATAMVGKARMLLHEMSHLAALVGQDEVIIKDQDFNPKAIQRWRIYGIWWVQRMADSRAGKPRTHLNADSYAWYATLKYFEALYGTPDAYLTKDNDAPPGEPEDEPPKQPEAPKPTKALNIILENSRHGVPNDKDFYSRWKYLFFSVDFGTSSICQVDPAPKAEAPVNDISQGIKAHLPSGTFDVQTQDGMCQYKNDGKGNAGALWCGDTAHSCKEHADFRKGREGDVYCRNLSERVKGFVEQRAVVACEW